MHKPQDVLAQEIKNANKQVEIGAFYYHYKNSKRTYKVLNLGFTEVDDEICVIYEAQYGKNIIFVRSLKSWLATVIWKGNSKQKRFTKI